MSKREFTIYNDYSETEVAELEKAYSKSLDQGHFKVGKVVTGFLYSKTNNELNFVTYGKTQITVKLSSEENAVTSTLEIGAKTGIEITGIEEEKTGYFVYGSVAKVKQNEIKEFLDEAYDHESILTGVVKEMNQGGYIVELSINDSTTSMFMPNLLTSVNKLFEPAALVGQEIDVILDVVNKNGTDSYVCNRKKYLQTLIPHELGKLIKGGKYEGFITGKTDFAAFIQFNGCLTAMIHKSNLEAPLEEIKTGDSIIFYVKDVIKDRLFCTQVQKDSLWDTIKVDDELSGEVSSIKDFGLMIQLDYETKGLLHRSVLKGKSPEEWQKGDAVYVKVTAINKTNRQITLALC